MNLLGLSKNKIHLIDIQLSLLHNILHEKGTNDPVDELDEAMILDCMSAIGGIMIGILNLHFRESKQTGFRIPEDLKEDWSLN